MHSTKQSAKTQTQIMRSESELKKYKKPNMKQDKKYQSFQWRVHQKREIGNTLTVMTEKPRQRIFWKIGLSPNNNNVIISKRCNIFCLALCYYFLGFIVRDCVATRELCVENKNVTFTVFSISFQEFGWWLRCLGSSCDLWCEYEYDYITHHQPLMDKDRKKILEGLSVILWL